MRLAVSVTELKIQVFKIQGQHRFGHNFWLQAYLAEALFHSHKQPFVEVAHFFLKIFFEPLRLWAFRLQNLNKPGQLLCKHLWGQGYGMLPSSGFSTWTKLSTASAAFPTCPNLTEDQRLENGRNTMLAEAHIDLQAPDMLL